MGTGISQSAGELFRHRAFRVSVYEVADRLIGEHQHVIAPVQISSLYFFVAHVGVGKLELLQYPPRPAFVKGGHEAPVKANTRAAKPFPPRLFLGRREV